MARADGHDDAGVWGGSAQSTFTAGALSAGVASCTAAAADAVSWVGVELDDAVRALVKFHTRTVAAAA